VNECIYVERGVCLKALGTNNTHTHSHPFARTHSQKDAVGGGKAAAGGGSSTSSSSNKDPVTVALNTNDPLYAEIRDLHLEALGQTLNEKCVAWRGVAGCCVLVVYHLWGVGR
jgi:hypothetical protein